MKNTHFYIAMPIYKVEKYLRSSVESALAQTYQDFEIIMVDDGSPDRCGEICDEYAARDARIHVIHKENGGVLSARVAAIQFIRTHGSADDFMVSLDPDDLIAPNALEVLNKAIIETGSDLIYFRNLDLYPDGHTVPNDPPDMPCGTITDRKLLYHTVFLNWGYGSLWRKAVKVCVLPSGDYKEFYDMRVAEDYFLSFDIVKACQNASFIPDPLYLYRQVPNSLTNSFTFQNFRSNDFLMQFLWDSMQEENVWDAADFSDCLDFCKESTRRSVWMYLKFFAPLSDKKAKIEEMMVWPINQEVLAHATRKDWDYRLIRQGKYWILHLIGLLIGILRFIYRQAKRLKTFFISHTRRG